MAKKSTETKAPAARKPRALKGAAALPVDAAPMEAAEPVVVVAAAPIAVDPELVRARAYEIWREEGGTPMDNWLRAERELRR